MEFFHEKNRGDPPDLYCRFRPLFGIKTEMGWVGFVSKKARFGMILRNYPGLFPINLNKQKIFGILFGEKSMQFDQAF